MSTEFTNTFSEEVWKQKYKYGDDNNVDHTLKRVAKDLASKEVEPEKWSDEFYSILEGFQFVPGGRILSNAGTGLTGTTYINCFSGDALVITKAGVKEIKDVEIGDEVLTHKGRYEKVVSTMNRHYDGDVDVYSSSLLPRDIVCTPEHKFYQGNDRWEESKNNNVLLLADDKSVLNNIVLDMFEEVKDVKRNGISKNSVSFDESKVYNITSVHIANRDVNTRNSEINRFVEVNEDFAYFIGRFVGDGSTFSVNKAYEVDGFNIAFHSNELSVAESLIEKLYKNVGLLANINKSKSFNGVYLRKSSPLFSNFLMRSCGRYSHSKKIPSFIWESPSNIKLTFLLGLFDSDGMVSKSNISILLNNENLINEIQLMLAILGFPSSKSVCTVKNYPKNKYYKLLLVNKYAKAFLSKISKSYSDNRIKRLLDKDYTRIIPGGFKAGVSTKDCGSDGNLLSIDRFIKRKEKYDGVVYNISVENDKSYTVNGIKISNCYVSGFSGNDQDSIEGIYDALYRQAKILQSEGGYGFCCDVMRPRGAHIFGIAGSSPGPVKFLELWDKSSEIITEGAQSTEERKDKKGSIRKGAQMVTMSCWHPSVFQFVEAKKTPGVLSKFNMSVLCTDAFMKAVENGEDWNLIFPDYENYKEQYEKSWDGNIDLWIKENGPSSVKTYKTIKAAELWNFIMKNTYERNEPGVLFVDTMNRLNNLWYVENISATNPCVAKGTLVNTPAGYRKVEDIKVGDLICTAIGAEPVKTIEKHENYPVYKVVFSDGGEQVVTAAHRYHVSDKFTKRDRIAKLEDLNVGDRVRVESSEFADKSFDEEKYLAGLKCGILLGDGCYTRTDKIKRIEIASNKDDSEYNDNVKRLFGEENFIKDKSYKSKAIGLNLKPDFNPEELGIKYGEYSYQKSIDMSLCDNLSYVIGVLDGLLVTDGNVNLKSNHPQIRWDTSSKQLAQDIRNLLLYLGCHGFIYSSFSESGTIDGRKIERRHDKNTITISGESFKNYCKNSKLLQNKFHPGKAANLLDALVNNRLSGNRWCAEIKSIEKVDNIDVYDLYCEVSDTWITSGYLQLGCGEQILPIGGVCLLGSLNLTQFVDNKTKNWDYEKLRRVIPIAVRLMDNVNDVTKVPLEEQRVNLRNKRRIGLGSMGYGSALIMLGVKYGSEQALKMTEELQNFIMNEAYKASAMLAKEKGPFPLFNREKYMAGEFVGRLSEETRRLIEEYGLRNSHLLSIQPNGNTGCLANIVSGGLEPVFCLSYYRTSIQPAPPDGMSVPKHVDWSNRTFTSDITKWDWVKEGDEWLLATNFNGKIWKFDRTRGLLKEEEVADYGYLKVREAAGDSFDSNADFLATSMELSADAHVETMGVFAKYVDSAISKTINVRKDFPFDEFKEIYVKAWKNNIKGFTTYREGTMTAVLSKTATTITPKDRPKELKCDVHHVSVSGQQYVVLVGLMENKPYEIFACKNNAGTIDKHIKSGKIIKKKKDFYKAEFDDGETELSPITAVMAEVEEVVSRLCSNLLRLNGDISTIIHQLEKTGKGREITSFSKCLARVLKKYIPDEELKDKTCPECNKDAIVRENGCCVCKECGYSACT